MSDNTLESQIWRMIARDLHPILTGTSRFGSGAGITDLQAEIKSVLIKGEQPVGYTVSMLPTTLRSETFKTIWGFDGWY